MNPVELTKRLVELPTVTHNTRAEDVATIERILQENGYEVRGVQTSDTTHFLATQGIGEMHLAFVSHYDVVPAGEKWNTPPFIPTEKDGFLYGRGVSDMKAALAAQITAGQYLSSLGLRVSLFIAGDEETVSKGMPALLNLEHPKISFAIGGEPTSKSKSGDVIKVGRRGVMQGRITIHGEGGHTAYTPTERNPIHSFFRGAYWQSLIEPRDDGNTDFEPTYFNISAVQAGDGTFNVIPGEIVLQFDARISPKTTLEVFETSLHDCLQGLQYDLKITKRTNPFYTNDQQFREIASQAIMNINGSNPTFNCNGGTSDARFFAWKGIPTLEIGVPGGNIHKPNEYVATSEILRLEQIYKAIGRRILK